MCQGWQELFVTYIFLNHRLIIIIIIIIFFMLFVFIYLYIFFLYILFNKCMY